MAGGVQDTLTYKVDLDTQGLAAQLASVRDVVGRGLSMAAGAAQTGLEVVGGATNRLSSDIMMGQQMIAAAMPAQLGLSQMGAASLTLSNIPGMPQTFGQEISALAGISRAPVGVFPDQYKAIAGQRLNERIQNMGAGAVGAAGGVAGSLIGAAIGNMLLPGFGGIIGTIAGGMVGDHAMAPLVNTLDGRISERARIQQMFGWNSYRDDQRASMAEHIAHQSIKSILSAEAFNNVLPAAAMSGFFSGIKGGDVRGFKQKFSQAEQFFVEGQYALQMSGTPQDIMAQGQMALGFRNLGVRGAGKVMPLFNKANVLTQQMREIGEYVSVEEIVHQQLEVGSAAQSMGLSPQRAMELHTQQSSVTNRLISEGRLSDEDVALLGGATQAGGRMAMATMASQRNPVFKAMALAFSSGVPGGGIDNAAIEAAGGAGRMTFSSLAERMSQQLGSGTGGTTKLISALANQGKLQGDMMANQGAMLRGMTDDLLKQANMELTEDTRMFVMQRAFGVGESESRAFVRGQEMEAPAKKRMDEESLKLDRDIKGAVGTAQTGVAREITQFTRSIKEGFADAMDPLIKRLADKLVPPLEDIRDDLRKSRGGTPQSSKSPISSGSVDFSGHDGTWMIPKDPMSMQGFRAASESRKFPEPMVSMRAETLKMSEITRLTSLRRSLDTMAG